MTCSSLNLLFSYISITTHTLYPLSTDFCPLTHPYSNPFMPCKFLIPPSWVSSNFISIRKFPWKPSSTLRSIYLQIQLNLIHIFIPAQVIPHGNCVSASPLVYKLFEAFLFVFWYMAQCLAHSRYLEMFTEWMNKQMNKQTNECLKIEN